jgi:hypothetical protein
MPTSVGPCVTVLLAACRKEYRFLAVERRYLCRLVQVLSTSHCAYDVCASTIFATSIPADALSGVCLRIFLLVRPSFMKQPRLDHLYRDVPHDAAVSLASATSALETCLYFHSSVLIALRGSARGVAQVGAKARQRRCRATHRVPAVESSWGLYADHNSHHRQFTHLRVDDACAQRSSTQALPHAAARTV